jgi:hypothetical protein
VIFVMLASAAVAQVPTAPGSLSSQVVDSGQQQFDGPAQLPQVYIDSSLAATPTPGARTFVAAGTNLQTVLNNASCGDVLLLQTGATWNGKFTLPAKACDDQHWIQIRSAATDSNLPPEGARINPCYAGVASLPGRPQFSCSITFQATAKINYSSTSGSGPLAWASGANHYRIGPGLEITRSAGTGAIGALVVGAAINHVVYDRIWMHGTSQDETGSGIGLGNQNYVSIVDSYFSDFHCTVIIGTCTDAHPIGGGLDSLQAGPFKIHNNFIEGAGQGVLFGGGSATFTPADIEVDQNHFFKPLTWMYGQSGFVGGADPSGACATKYPNVAGQCPFIVKNQFELKNAQRVLIEGNLFDNVWGGFSQVGFSILLTPKNQAGSNGTNLCPLCMVQDVTIRYDRLSHMGAGIAIANAPSDNGGEPLAGQRYSVHDITIDDISVAAYNGGGGTFQINSAAGSAAILNSIKIDHITAFPDYNGGGKIITLGGSTTYPMYGFWFTNSILGATKFPIWNVGGTTNCAVYNVPLTSLNACFPSGYTFTNSAFIGINQSNYPVKSWPAGNVTGISCTSAGCQSMPVTYVQFVNYNNGVGGDYHLASSSPFKNAGSDGKDLGADIDAINQATAGAN